MKITLIAAVSQNNIIGSRGKLPWHIQSEMTHFRETTQGNVIIMGRKTFDSIGIALPKRLSIVVSRTKQADEVEKRLLYATSVEEAVTKAKQHVSEYPTAFIIGGTQIYKYALENELCDELLISRIPLIVEGDATFPNIPTSYKKQGEVQKEGFTVETYEKEK